MAVFRCTYKSSVLKEYTNFMVVLPEECTNDVPWILLLHGLSGNDEDWTRFTAVERYAREQGYALLMPSAEASWYTDEVYGKAYFTYVTTELVDYVRSMFPLSKKREKSFVAGLSMGGYGALKVGLRCPDKFAGISSLSGVVDIYHRFRTDDEDKWGVGYECNAIRCWGQDYEEVLKDKNGNLENIHSLLRDFDYNAGITPWIYTACGTEDRHYKTNVELSQMMDKLPIVHEWHDKPGRHTWDVWDYYIPQVMEFFTRCTKAQLEG